jgi:hypothetical protein
MWLPETAVDLESLNCLAESGIKFTVLAPYQAKRFRKIGEEKWEEASGKIDPARAYRCRLPSGRDINLFFYDGPISRAVAFERLLEKGEDFASRLIGGFSDSRDWPQLLHIATDGETYGHHHRFADMALAYALHYMESQKLAQLTNYGEYLEKVPPTHEVEIIENTSWSCAHGVERWKSNCGCNAGGHPAWNQAWRAPLREALDWLRDQLISRYEQKAGEYLKDPWQARNDYIEVILNRCQERINKFFEEQAVKKLSINEEAWALKLLELQRHAMLMYTSCGWFFDELSGLETVQVIQYAARVLQLSDEIFSDDLEPPFLERLAKAKSNIPEHKDGGQIYEKLIKPGILDLKKVGVHYAVSSLFTDYPDEADIYCYHVNKEEHKKIEDGKTALATGRAQVNSQITGESARVIFSILYMGDHAYNGGVREFPGAKAYQTMAEEIRDAFEKGAFADVVRLMDKHFGMYHYSLKDLFKDEQRKILNSIIKETMEEFETSYRQMYDNHRILMGFLTETALPVPRPFFTAAEFTLNLDIQRAFGDEINVEKIQSILKEIRKLNVPVDGVSLEFVVRRKIEKEMGSIEENPSDLSVLKRVEKTLGIAFSLPIQLNLWEPQNIYYRTAKKIYQDYQPKAAQGDQPASQWTEQFKSLGQKLSFNLKSILPGE